jgi:drug/metabolite transporter (DMT)-like permease
LVLLVLASVGFGAGNVITKAILNLGVSPMTLIPGRYFVGTVVLLTALAATDRLHPSGRIAWRHGLILGAINMAAPTILSTLGLVYIPASVAAMLVALIPLATIVAAHYIVDGEPLRASLLPGFVIALIGCVLLVRGDGTTGDNAGLGVVLLLGGILAASLGGALSRRFALGTPAVHLIVPQFLGAGIIAVAAAIPAGGLLGFAELTPTGWYLLMMSGAVATALPFWAILRLSELASAAKTSLVAYLVPLVGVTGSVVLLGEPLTSGLVIGGALILLGVVIAEQAERRRSLPIAAV